MLSRILPGYETGSEESSSDENEERTNKRVSYRSLNWRVDKSCPSRQDALDTINSENTWSFHYQSRTAAGVKCYYRCNKVKRY